jgi:hypothetical protein
MFNFILCFCPRTDKHLAVLSGHTSGTQYRYGLVYNLSTAQDNSFYTECYTYGN